MKIYYARSKKVRFANILNLRFAMPRALAVDVGLKFVDVVEKTP